MCGARRLQRRNGAAAAWFFLLLVSFLLLLQITTTGDDEQPVHVGEGSHSPPPMSGVGGGGEQQELSRLGSRPPCCERKCSGCLPCQAVQVRTSAAEGAAAARLQPQCADYEPVGWKCKCGGAVFDP